MKFLYPILRNAIKSWTNVYQNKSSSMSYDDFVGSVVEWLKRRDQHGLGSKPTRAILLCPWERHFTALSPPWWS